MHGLAGAPLGWLADRLGPRRLALAGGGCLALGLVLDGAVTRPWHLYVSFGLLTAAGVAACGWMPAVILVQRWFPRRLGTMLGITSAGIGVGIFLVVPAAQYAIDLVGWRAAFRLFGLGSSGPWAAGWIFDTTGSYAVAFVAALACGAVAAAALWIAAPRRLRRGRVGP